MYEKLGIDLLKDLATDFVGIVKKYVAAKNDDGRVSKIEWISMIPKGRAVVKDLMNYQQLIAQAKDIDSEEGKELIDHIVSLDVVGDKAEIVMINLLEIVEGEIAIYNNNVVPIINIFKKV